MERTEIAHAFQQAAWKDKIAKLIDEGKLPTLPFERGTGKSAVLGAPYTPSIVDTHIGFENIPDFDIYRSFFEHDDASLQR